MRPQVPASLFERSIDQFTREVDSGLIIQESHKEFRLVVLKEQVNEGCQKLQIGLFCVIEGYGQRLARVFEGREPRFYSQLLVHQIGLFIKQISEKCVLSSKCLTEEDHYFKVKWLPYLRVHLPVKVFAQLSILRLI